MVELIKHQCQKCGNSFIGSTQIRIEWCPDCKKKYKNAETAERNKELFDEHKAFKELQKMKRMASKSKSLLQVTREVEEYNRKHGTHLSYGEYVNILGVKI